MRLLKSGSAWAVFFVASRLGMFLIWHTYTQYLASDVNYYHFFLAQAQPGLSNTMVEYPAPAVWILQALNWIAGGEANRFFAVFAISMIALDALVAYLLWRGAPAAGAFWIVFSLANGAIVWFRFDLVPAALVALACLYLLTRPRLSGALVGLGAAIKLWPALLIVPMIAPDLTGKRSLGRQRLLGFCVVGFGLAAASLLTTGWQRTVSPVVWQAERGLQIESVPATPYMFWHAFGASSPWTFALSEFNAWEVYGPGVDAMVTASTLLTIGAVALTGWAAWRLWQHRGQWIIEREVEAITLAALLVPLAMIISNKTFSTQYMLWIGGPIAVLLINAATSPIRRQLWTIAFFAIGLGLATQYIYPWGYGLILAEPFGDAYATSILVMRNIGVVAMMIYTAALLWRVTRNISSSIASSRHGSWQHTTSEEGDRGFRR